MKKFLDYFKSSSPYGPTAIEYGVMVVIMVVVSLTIIFTFIQVSQANADVVVKDFAVTDKDAVVELIDGTRRKFVLEDQLVGTELVSKFSKSENRLTVEHLGGKVTVFVKEMRGP